MAIMDLTKDNFNETLENNDIVVLDFWAKWCGPCLSFKPVFQQVSEKFPQVTFAQVNIEEEPSLAEDFDVRQIPLIMILREQVVLFSEAGTMPASALSDLIEQAKALDMAEVKKNFQSDNP